jgi:flavin reductase (DIM6/NTAB) family NADH-FMN oxidoreductase RutF
MTDPRLRSGIQADPGRREGVTSAPEADALRDAFSLWATGVTVVTVKDESGIHGLTASAFTPVSLRPPLVLVCIGKGAAALTHVQDAGHFTVNILDAGQKRCRQGPRRR